MTDWPSAYGADHPLITWGATPDDAARLCGGEMVALLAEDDQRELGDLDEVLAEMVCRGVCAVPAGIAGAAWLHDRGLSMEDMESLYALHRRRLVRSCGAGYVPMLGAWRTDLDVGRDVALLIGANARVLVEGAP